MPSPLAHATVGYLIYRLTRRSLPATAGKLIGPLPLLLIWTVIFALLPDADAIVGLASGEFGRYHNNGTHSIVLGLAVALLAAGLIWIRVRKDFLPWFLTLWLSYTSHVVLDFLTFGGRGVMMLWPFSSQRYDSTIKLFYGVRWSEGIFSREHLLTLATELVLVLFVGLALMLFRGGTRAGAEQTKG